MNLPLKKPLTELSKFPLTEFQNLQTTSPLGVVHVSRSHVDGNGNTQRIHEDVPFPALDMLMGIKATNARRLLNRLDADAASMMAALGCGFFPCRSRSARCSACNKSVQVPYASQATKMIEHRLPRREICWQVTPGAAGAQDIENRVARWSAESGLVVCHVWIGEADSVGGSSTQHQKDCLDMWYSFLQSIT
jgi:hypothetical protein